MVDATPHCTFVAKVGRRKPLDLVVCVWETLEDLQQQYANCVKRLDPKKRRSSSKKKVCAWFGASSKQSELLGELHLCLPYLDVDSVSHESVHAASEYLRSQGKEGSEEDMAILVGNLAGGIISYLAENGVTKSS